MKDVFISYKAEEIEEASWVKSVLEGNGISCWMAPACIPGGSSYAVEIPQAIRQAKVFVLILSSKAQTSRWVSREVDLAINEGKIVLPFMLENCALKDDFNFYLTNVQRYAAYENKVVAVEKMIKEIKALLGKNEGASALGDAGAVAQNRPAQEPKGYEGFGTPPQYQPRPQSQPQSQPQFQPQSRPQSQPQFQPQSRPQFQTNTQPLPQNDSVCILSLIFGIFATLMLGLWIVPNIAAIVLSIIGLNNIYKKGIRGKGLAIAGQVLGLVSTVVGLSVWFSEAGLIISLLICAVSLIMFVNRYKKLK